MAMFEDLPQEFLYLLGAAFVVGWLVAKIGAMIGRRATSKSRDPRENRIRSLEADLRVAQTDAGKARDELESRVKEFGKARDAVAKRNKVIDEQKRLISRLKVDLKESVRKTRELRSELTDRATENVKSEVKLREVETELEVSRASTDMMATGVLDYSVAPDSDAGDSGDDASVVKAAS